jgi:hypothetical protein
MRSTTVLALMLACPGWLFAQNSAKPIIFPQRPESLPPAQASPSSLPATDTAPAPLPPSVASPGVEGWNPFAGASLATLKGAKPREEEKLVRFDPQRLDLAWTERGFQLTAGDVLLKDFGRRDVEAREVLRIVRDLGLNERGTIGSPSPVLEYWLRDGKAPQGVPAGMSMVAFDPGTLRVEQNGGMWVLRDAGRVLFTFGSVREDAENALALVRRYGFNQVGMVGRNTPAMLLFFAPGDPNGNAPALTSTRVRPPIFNTDKPAQARQEGSQQANPTKPASGAPFPSAVVPGLRPVSLQTPAVNAPSARGPSPASGGLAQTLPMVQFGPHGNENPAGAGKEPARVERLPFDWRRVQIRQLGNQWVLGIGEMVFSTLGSEAEARLALDVVRRYRFTEWRRVGEGAESFSYFLINGQTPHGVMSGVQAEPFQPDLLSVRQVENRQAICQGGHPLIILGERTEDAQELLREIQRQRCDHICRVGTGSQALTFLVRSR